MRHFETLDLGYRLSAKGARNFEKKEGLRKLRSVLMVVKEILVFLLLFLGHFTITYTVYLLSPVDRSIDFSGRIAGFSLMMAIATLIVMKTLEKEGEDEAEW